MRIKDISKDQMDKELIQEVWNVHREYLSRMCSKFNERSDELQTELDKIEMNFANHDQVVEQQENFLAMNEDYYQGISIFFSSLFVSSYSIFEYQLIEMCHRSKEINGLDRSVRKVSSISGAQIYLKEAKIDLCQIRDGDRDLWHDINTYRKIRNRIVHHNSRVKTNFARFKSVVDEGVVEGRNIRTGVVERMGNYKDFQKTYGDNYKGVFRLALHQGFCKKVINTFENFVMEIIAAQTLARQNSV